MTLSLFHGEAEFNPKASQAQETLMLGCRPGQAADKVDLTSRCFSQHSSVPTFYRRHTLLSILNFPSWGQGLPFLLLYNPDILVTLSLSLYVCVLCVCLFLSLLWFSLSFLHFFSLSSSLHTHFAVCPPHGNLQPRSSGPRKPAFIYLNLN